MGTFDFGGDGAGGSAMYLLLLGLAALAAAAGWNPGHWDRRKNRRTRLMLAGTGLLMASVAGLTLFLPGGGFVRLAVWDGTVLLTYERPDRQVIIPMERLRSMSWREGQRRRGPSSHTLRLTTTEGEEYGSSSVSSQRATAIRRDLDRLVVIPPAPPPTVPPSLRVFKTLGDTIPDR